MAVGGMQTLKALDVTEMDLNLLLIKKTLDF